MVENGVIKGLILFSDIYYTYTFWISFLEAASDPVRHSLLLFAKKTAQERKKREVQIIIPEDNELLTWVEGNGFTSWERNNDFIVFDFPLEVLIK